MAVRMFAQVALVNVRNANNAVPSVMFQLILRQLIGRAGGTNIVFLIQSKFRTTQCVVLNVLTFK